jgi:hypothetical protein
MKNLIRKDLMTSTLKPWHLFGLIVLIYSGTLFIPLIDEFFIGISYMVLAFPAMFYFLNLFYYADPSMYKAEILLPLKKSHIIGARYMTYVFLIFFNLMSMLLLLCVRYFLGRVVNLDVTISQLALGVSLVLIFGALLLLLVFIFGQQKVKVFAIVSCVGMFAVGIALTRGLIHIFDLSNVTETYRHTGIYVSFFLPCALFYVVSCVISTAVFNKKQF